VSQSVTRERTRRQTAPVRPDVYTVDEAARIMKVSPSTFRERLKDAGIPHVRMGRLIRIPAAQFHRWLDSIGVTP
jgi:excisionase family DNA binding protein